MNIALIGSGRMGRMLESLCEKDEGLHVAGFVGRTGYASLADMEQVDAALDFSYPGNLESLLACAVAKKIPLVIGTTGLSKEQGEAIRKANGETAAFLHRSGTRLSNCLRARGASGQARARNRRACSARRHGCGRTQRAFLWTDGRNRAASSRGQPRNLCPRRIESGGFRDSGEAGAV